MALKSVTILSHDVLSCEIMCVTHAIYEYFTSKQEQDHFWEQYYQNPFMMLQLNGLQCSVNSVSVGNSLPKTAVQTSVTTNI